PDELSSLPQVPLSWVAVAIPSDAKRREVGGKTAVPEHVAENGQARFYPADSNADPKLDHLELRYDSEPSEKMKLFSKYASKLVVVMLPSLIALTLIVLPEDQGTRRARTWAIWIGGVTVAILSMGILVYAWHRGES